MARARTLDFSKLAETQRFNNGKQKSLSRKQIRARARRRAAKGKSTANEMDLLYKPVEEWDAEELAHGRPRSSDGSFCGRTPTWVSRELYERAMSRFQEVIREDVQTEAAGALQIVRMLMQSEEVDAKGKPIVPPSVKLDAAKWLVEHVIGKPTQRVENDISVKLQAVLAQVVWEPGEDIHPAFQGPVRKVIDSAPNTFEGFIDVEDDDG